MTTETINLGIIEAENSFTPICQSIAVIDPCPNPAEWMLWCTHTTPYGCPGSFYTCGRCLQANQRKIEYWMSIRPDGICAACDQPLEAGNLSDHFRFIKL